MRRPYPSFALVLIGGLAAACATGPKRPEPARPETAAAAFAMRPVSFDDLPGWQSADLAPALAAFRRQCENWRTRSPAALTQGGRYGGPIGGWLAACAAADQALPAQARAFFEAHFTPAAIAGSGEARLTAYYEPVVEARRAPAPGFDAPLLKRPGDMVTVDLEAFASAYDSEVLRGAPRTLTGKIEGARVEPYPQRGEIAPAPGQAFAWTHPADLYNLQVQGSGRLRFPDGETRAQFSAQNGYRWRSALGALRDEGRLNDPTWQGFRRWLDAHPGEAERALALDPSYVFFDETAIADPTAGPRGAAGVPLTPMGSMAIDPAFHPYGALLYVDATYDGAPFEALLVAQDTGGAIKRGPRRGDVFFGSGADAGARAERMNAQGVQFWTLLPKGTPMS